MTRATAPGKLILFGEHAVVYGQPALAVPVPDLQVCVDITPLDNTRDRIRILAPDIDQQVWLDELPEDNPLARIITRTYEALAIKPASIQLRITSSIPVAAGMGSSAAVSIAIVRALAAFAGKSLPPEQQSKLAFDVERIHHGSPSGIDNTVIAYNQPVWFIRGQQPEPFHIPVALPLVIADTGIHTPTSEAVAHVRRQFEQHETATRVILDQIGNITRQARVSLNRGDLHSLGSLMNENQSLLRSLGVSCPALDKLILTSLEHGALGAKLSGAGLGGNMIALIHNGPDPFRDALKKAGASQVVFTRIQT